MRITRCGRRGGAVGPDPLFQAPASAERLTRSGLIASQVMGLALMRHAWKIEPIATMSDDDLAAAIGPTVQRYVDGDIGASAGPAVSRA
jgi:Tetracyclin repressor-like, C-terminal domain